MEPWKTIVVQGERHQRSLAIRIEKGCDDRRHWTCEQIVCQKYRLPLKTFIPNFVAFFVLLGIAVSCIRKMSFSVTSAKREFTPATVSLFTSRKVDIVHWLEIASQSDCLKYQRHRVCIC